MVFYQSIHIILSCLFICTIVNCSKKAPEPVINSNFNNEYNSNYIEKSITPKAPTPVKLKSWSCDDESIFNKREFESFTYCEPPVPPRLKVDDYITPIHDDNYENTNLCEPQLDGTFPLYGKKECQPIGDPCPEETFPIAIDNLIGDVKYVLSDTDNSGDGTKENPFNTINSALEQADNGDTIVIGPGIYKETLELEKDINLLGSCVQKTIIEAPGPHGARDSAAIYIISNIKTTIKNILITGEQVGINIKAPEAIVNISNIWIFKAKAYGIYAKQGNIIVNNVLISHTLPSIDGKRGRGIGMFYGPCELLIANTTIEANHDMGIQVDKISDNQTPLGTLNIQNVIINNTLPRKSDNYFGRGINIINGPIATIKNSLILNNSDVAIAASGINSEINLYNTVIKNTLSNKANKEAGFGLMVRHGSKAKLDQVLISNNRTYGIWTDISTSDEPTTIEAKNIVIENTNHQESDLTLGRGIEIRKESIIDLNNALIINNKSTGLVLYGESISANLNDVVITNTKSSAYDESLGRGLVILNGPKVIANRILINENIEAGIQIVGEKTNADFTNLTVINTKSTDNYRDYGLGIIVQDGASLTLSESKISNNKDIGILCINNSTINITDVLVEDIKQSDCATLSYDSELYCEQFAGGYGIGIIDNSLVIFNSLKISNSAFLGVQVANNSILSGNGIEITNNHIGVNIQNSAEYNFNEEVTDLIMRNNNENFFNKDELPIPDLPNTN